MATWNVRGKSLPQIADVLSDQRIHFDALALQEVGSLAQGTPEPDGFLHLDDAQVQFHPFLSQYWIVCTDQLNSHLGQALLIDRSYADSIVTTLKGHRFIGAQFVHTGGSKMWLFSGHLPHHQLPLSEYTEAIHELQRFLDKAHNIPCIIGADWNATPTGDNLDAQGLELACLIAANQLHPLMPPVPTWKHKFYDFFIASPAFINLVAEEAMPLRAPEVAPHLDNLLPTDHKLVTLDTVLAPGTCRHRGPRHHNRAGRWLVDNNSLTTIVEQSTAPLTWEGLCGISQSCQYRTPSRKYRDSDAIKQLCHARNQVSDEVTRASLTRNILKLRREARTQWISDLHDQATAGDPSAISFLQRRHKRRPDWGGLISASGTPQAAAAAVQQHFTNVFANQPLCSRDAECAPFLATLRNSMAQCQPTPITTDELAVATGRLKPGKTSGATGMSNEFLVALGQVSNGPDRLIPLLNDMLFSGTMPQEVHVGIACLLPKATHIHKPEQIRPILLLEVLQKLYAGILMRRLQPFWPPLAAQLGAVPGGQPIEALFAAHCMMSIVEVSDMNPIYVKLDIRGAFDNIRHASIAQFLTHLPPAVAFEAHGLMKLLLEQRLLFNFLHDEWVIHSANGTPQGGSHSAGLFARVLDHAVGQVTAKWEADGHTSVFPPIWLLLFVDDILLTFKGWAQATCLLPSLLAALQQIGLCINYAKSCVVANKATIHSMPPKHLLGILAELQWTCNTQYLRKPLGFEIGHDSLLQSVVQLIHQAWGRLKPLLKKCHWSRPLTTMTLMNRYVGACFLWLSPILYPYKTTQTKLQVTQTTLMVEALNLYMPDTTEQQAQQLHRLRRHVVREWIIHASATRGWLAECLRRYWSFLGHICRQDFCPPHPSRIMLTHLATRHTGGLNRPGPWHTAHSLIRKFWSECGIDHDYLYYAQDRDAWRDLGRRFLCWMGQPESITNTELLPTNPWESKGQLLRQQAQWLHTAVLTVQVDTILIAWLDTRDGPSKLSTPLHSPTTASTILDGFLQLEGHLRMAYQPFVQQLAISQHHIWQLLLEQEPCCHQTICTGCGLGCTEPRNQA
eukprot:Skav231763  [mRNA]  locus=scaffold695:213065:216289:- [translate_table: standard]